MGDFTTYQKSQYYALVELVDGSQMYVNIRLYSIGPSYFIWYQGSSRIPPEIHPEQEDPLNLDEENDPLNLNEENGKIEGSVLNKSWSNYIIRTQDTYYMSRGTLPCPPQIQLEQEDPLNLDEENVKIEGSALHKSWSKYLIRTQNT